MVIPVLSSWPIRAEARLSQGNGLKGNLRGDSRPAVGHYGLLIDELLFYNFVKFFSRNTITCHEWFVTKNTLSTISSLYNLGRLRPLENYRTTNSTFTKIILPQ